MPRRNILGLFIHFFPHFGEILDVWFPHGKNCIRVRLTSGPELVFTYNGPKNWTLETAGTYLENKKGALKM